MKVSFDFDGTLDDDFDGSFNSQKEEIQKIASKFLREGHDVCIITKRIASTESDKVYTLAKKLGINKIYFTNRELKHTFILNMKIDMHFENNQYEVDIISKYCEDNNHKCVVVPILDKYWRDLVY